MVGLVMSADRISMQQRRKEIINDLQNLPGMILALCHIAIRYSVCQGILLLFSLISWLITFFSFPILIYQPVAGYLKIGLLMVLVHPQQLWQIPKGIEYL